MGDTLITLVTAFGASLAGAALGGLFSFWITRKSNKENYLQKSMEGAEQLVSFMARQTKDVLDLCSAILDPDNSNQHEIFKRALNELYIRSPEAMWETNSISYHQYLVNAKIENYDDCYYKMRELMIYLASFAGKMEGDNLSKILEWDTGLYWTRGYQKKLYAKCLALPDEKLINLHFREIRRKGEAA